VKARTPLRTQIRGSLLLALLFLVYLLIRYWKWI
jgi:hypothetical protein